MPEQDDAEHSHDDERDELVLGALAAAGQQINELAGEARQLKEAARRTRKDDRRRDILLVLMFVLLVLKLVSEGFAWQERNDIKEQGRSTQHLVETVNRCINPDEGEEPDCGQDSGSDGGQSAAGQAVIALSHYQLDVAYCAQADVVPDELQACVDQRQVERANEDGGTLPPGP